VPRLSHDFLIFKGEKKTMIWMNLMNVASREKLFDLQSERLRK